MDQFNMDTIIKFLNENQKRELCKKLNEYLDMNVLCEECVDVEDQLLYMEKCCGFLHNKLDICDRCQYCAASLGCCFINCPRAVGKIECANEKCHKNICGDCVKNLDDEKESIFFFCDCGDIYCCGCVCHECDKSIM